MLTIKVDESEYWDEANNEFVYVKPTILKLEHSLVSISKWEAKFQKPFLNDEKRTTEEILEYIKCMSVGAEIQNETILGLSSENFKKITEYIDSPMTATWFNENKKNQGRQVITSELIYYLMVSYNIPFECQKWHINRLLTLIKVCHIKSEEHSGGKKMSKSEIISQNRELNAIRRAKHNSKG